MERYYVNIAGISRPKLELAGFVCLFQDDDFMLLRQKGDLHIVDKTKPYLFVDDRCDADFLKDLRTLETAIELGPEKEQDRN
jgi:hypothetical protein